MLPILTQAYAASGATSVAGWRCPPIERFGKPHRLYRAFTRGTSASALLIAAMIARISAELQKGEAARADYLTPVLYRTGADGHPLGSSTCRDITIGDNISPAGGGYRAGEDNDAVTGWGSPIASKLLAALLQIV